MNSLFQRILKFIQSNAHSFLNKYEDPIKLSEQAIRDLKKNYDESLKGLAEIKSVIITTKRNMKNYFYIAKDYTRKANMLQKNAQAKLISQEEADRLSLEALTKKKNALEEYSKLEENLKNYEAMAGKMQSKISDLKMQIQKYESELTTLKARYKVANSTKKINQQLAKINSDSATAMLEDMKTRVDEEEALASAYDEMIYLESDIDKEINNAIGTSYDSEVHNELSAIKNKLIGTNKESNSDNDPGKDLKDKLDEE